MSNHNIELLIGQPEGPNLEYKLVVPPPALVARVVAAFANGDGGVLVLGVKDNLEVVGLDPDAPAAAVVEAGIARIAPRPSVKHYPLKIEARGVTRHLYIVEVDKSLGSLATEDNKVYVRDGTTVRLASPEMPLPPVNRRTPRQVAEVLTLLTQPCDASTPARLSLIKQYLNLFHIVSQSSLIMRADGDEPPRASSDGSTLARLVMSSLVDTLEIFLSDLLFEIYLAEPRTLKSRAQVTIEEVLNCQDMAEVVRFLAGARVRELKRGAEEAYAKSFKQCTGLEPFRQAELPRVKLFFQVRHLCTHSNGIVGAQFIAKTRPCQQQEGDEYPVTLAALCEAATLFIGIAHRLDQAALDKYHLNSAVL